MEILEGIFDFDLDKCKGCGLCIDHCPNGALKLSERTDVNKEGNQYIKWDRDKCTYCTICAFYCGDRVFEHIEKVQKNKILLATNCS